MSEVASYLNTLIFTIVAKVICIVMLLMLFLPIGQRYAYALLTVAICLIVIIIVSLYRIRSYTLKQKALKNAEMKSSTRLTTCPDYYTKSVNNDGIICTNEYVAPNNKVKYRMGVNNNDLKTINLTKLSDEHGKEMGKLCDVISKPNGLFTQVAWTDIKSKCQYI